MSSWRQGLVALSLIELLPAAFAQARPYDGLGYVPDDVGVLGESA